MPVKQWSDLRFWKHGQKQVQDYLEHVDNILPARGVWYAALDLTPFDKVKCVILGQDPYHTKGMAHGLAFSVLPHVTKLPPSLVNILKEYQTDLNLPKPRNGDLRAWSSRGVLLLNTILTVEEGKALSHANIGWEKLVYEVIRALSERGRVVFLLMGKRASDFRAAGMDAPCIVTPHPSPLARGFLGTKPFSKVNEELVKLGVEPIDWRL